MAKLLLVDDDVDVIAQYEAALAGAGHELHTAYSATDARKLLKDGLVPDLAVFDIMMENGLPGFDLARELHRIAPKVPILMVSGINEELKMPIDFTPDERLPIYKFLNKPVPPQTLRTEIAGALASKK